VCFDWVSRV